MRKEEIARWEKAKRVIEERRRAAFRAVEEDQKLKFMNVGRISYFHSNNADSSCYLSSFDLVQA